MSEQSVLFPESPGFQIRLRARPDWVQVEQYDDGRTGYCFNLSRQHATVFTTEQEAAGFAMSIPADLSILTSKEERP